MTSFHNLELHVESPGHHYKFLIINTIYYKNYFLMIIVLLSHIIFFH